MSKCLSTAEDIPVFGKSAKSFRKSSLFDELPQDNHFDINKDQLDIGYSSKTSKKISFKDINFSNSVQNINLESNIANLSIDDDLSENLADMSFELEDNTYSKNLEVDPNRKNIVNYLMIFQLAQIILKICCLMMKIKNMMNFLTKLILI
ncbi:hypothetical protein F8M41_000235 [Gigaspora margarita]|uniref:Uncharacterized protein n=1 Tax=Gigaspora margarita TaxID=4874 RepID=A0A8H3XH01_GIGMA|nr:hypothetical protein F8M41_000235 [Gigaspora margarita]